MLIDMLMVVPLAGAVALMGIVISEIISIHQKYDKIIITILIWPQND
jgi:hypothetical protein